MKVHWFWCVLVGFDVVLCYSRRFATATARTASLGSHSRGMIQGRSGKWSGGVEARRALLSDGLTDCRKKKREEFDSHV